jgi:hypothetical protein
MTRSRRFWNWESRNRISFGQEQNSYVYYKHDHDAPERPYHPERVQSHVSFFMKTINTRPWLWNNSERQYEMSMRIYRCLIVSTPKNYTMYNKRTVVLDESCTSIYCTWCCTPQRWPHGVRDRGWDHVGDLEHVRILVNAGTERIDRVYFGGHSGGYWKNIDECHVVDGSVQVYSARASTITAPVRNGGSLVLKDVTSDEGRVETDHLRTSTRYWRKYR